jgi:lipoprotein-anchoring transpeptidase ErfK/SrfK
MRRLTAAAGSVLLLFALAACSGGGGDGGSGAAKGGKATETATPVAKVAVTPADGSKSVSPDAQVMVTTDGTITQVTLQGAGKTRTGRYGTGNTTWSTLDNLKPGTSYTLTAVAKNKDGVSSTTVTHFKTVTPSRTLKISDITPNSGETVGVGMPIIVDFNHDVTNKEAVEKALRVQSGKAVEGAWLWASDSEVIFRTKSYWPANEPVRVTANLTGVHAGKGLWGSADSARAFKIGTSHVVKISLRTDEAKFYFNGKLKRTVAVSGGTGGSDSHGNDFRTTGGIHLTMGAFDSVWMTSPNIKPGEPGYYHEIVYNDVRISNSGEFMHRNPGDPGCLGNSNCSHGCVRMTPSGAAWWRDTAYRGDPVIITGTSRSLAWDNGWGYWQKSWSSWQKGGETGAVTTAVLPAT